MGLKRISSTNNDNGPVRTAGKRLLRIAGSTADEIAVFYAAIAKILLGQAEDISDFAAARRFQKLISRPQGSRVAAANIPDPGTKFQPCRL